MGGNGLRMVKTGSSWARNQYWLSKMACYGSETVGSCLCNESVSYFVCLFLYLLCLVISISDSRLCGINLEGAKKGKHWRCQFKLCPKTGVAGR